MKQIISIIVISILLNSCSTPEKKTEKYYALYGTQEDSVIKQWVFHTDDGFNMRTYISTPEYENGQHTTLFMYVLPPPYDHTITGTFKFISDNKQAEYKKADSAFKEIRKQSYINKLAAAKQHIIDSMVNDSIKILELK